MRKSRSALQQWLKINTKFQSRLENNHTAPYLLAAYENMRTR